MSLSEKRMSSWTEEELALLRKFYPTKGSDIPQLRDHRSIIAIQKKASDLKIKKGISEPERIGKKVWMRCGMEAMLESENESTVDVRFTDGTLVRHCSYEKFLKGNIQNPNLPFISAKGGWTAEEIELVKLEYPENGADIPKLLARHTRNTIQRKAHDLGISKKITSAARNKWTEQELVILTEKYPSVGTEIPKILQRHSRSSVKRKACELNLHRINQVQKNN